MQLNLKVRLKNPVFWLTFVPALVSFIYTMLSCFGIVPSVNQNTILDALTAIVTALTTLGVLVDPTTKGVADSNRAMTYSEPQ